MAVPALVFVVELATAAAPEAARAVVAELLDAGAKFALLAPVRAVGFAAGDVLVAALADAISDNVHGHFSLAGPAHVERGALPRQIDHRRLEHRLGLGGL